MFKRNTDVVKSLIVRFPQNCVYGALNAGPMGPGPMAQGPGPMGPWAQKTMLLFFENHDFNIFRRSQSFIRPPNLEPRPKMTANGLSSYELFAKKVLFSA